MVGGQSIDIEYTNKDASYESVKKSIPLRLEK